MAVWTILMQQSTPKRYADPTAALYATLSGETALAMARERLIRVDLAVANVKFTQSLLRSEPHQMKGRKTICVIHEMAIWVSGESVPPPLPYGPD